MKIKTLWMLIATCLIVAILYSLGPKTQSWQPSTAQIQDTISLDQIEAYIAMRDNAHALKKDNESKLYWANSTKSKTKYALLYLHGFGASWKEGDPVHKWIATAIGANLFIPRLAYHGIDTTDAMLNYDINKAWLDIQHMIHIAAGLGDTLIVLGCSTGATWALLAAAYDPKRIGKLVLFSPNLKLKDPSAFILNNHWGVPIAKKVIGSDFITYSDQPKDVQQYWYCSYRVEAVAQLQELLESSLTDEVLQKIKCPTLSLFYYKNESEQDAMVDVPYSEKRLAKLGSTKLVSQRLATVGDHVMASSLKSTDLDQVYNTTLKFLTK